MPYSFVAVQYDRCCNNNQSVFQSKADHPRIRVFIYFCSRDLDVDFDPMTLTYELDQHSMKM